MDGKQTDKMDDFTYHIVQSILMALVLCCLLIAAATALFGENNFLQNSPYPALAIFIVFAPLIWKWAFKE